MAAKKKQKRKKGKAVARKSKRTASSAKRTKVTARGAAGRGRVRKAPAPKAASPAHNPWRAYADDLARELRTTVTVMRAFPAEQADFQPHPRSSSAMKLFHTFGVEQNAALMAVRGNLDPGKAFAMPTPSSLAEATDVFERAANAVVAAARSAAPSDWHRPQPFFTGPQQMGSMPAGVIASIMLADQIHHRGQLSVYLRMAGGKVPSIYGPSADEPW